MMCPQQMGGAHALMTTGHLHSASLTESVTHTSISVGCVTCCVLLSVLLLPLLLLLLVVLAAGLAQCCLHSAVLLLTSTSSHQCHVALLLLPALLRRTNPLGAQCPVHPPIAATALLQHTSSFGNLTSLAVLTIRHARTPTAAATYPTLPYLPVISTSPFLGCQTGTAKQQRNKNWPRHGRPGQVSDRRAANLAQPSRQYPRPQPMWATTSAPHAPRAPATRPAAVKMYSKSAATHSSAAKGSNHLRYRI
jgi:hypothetical protein